MRLKGAAIAKISSRKNYEPHVFLEVRFWPALCTVKVNATDKKSKHSVFFLFAKLEQPRELETNCNVVSP